MMTVRGFAESLLLLLFYVATSTSGLTIINQISSCKVETDQGTLDITSLAGSSSSPRFAGILSKVATRTYDWSPCVDFSEASEMGTQNCQGVAMCRIDQFELVRHESQEKIFNRSEISVYTAFGTQATSNFVVNGDNNLELQLSSDINTAHIVCLCSTATDNVLSTDESDPLNPIFQLSGTHACLVSSSPNGSGLSVGSILCIIFFSILFLYFVIGMVYMKFRLRETGANLVPNKNVWTAVPVNVKYGFLLVKAGFRPERIAYNRT